MRLEYLILILIIIPFTVTGDDLDLKEANVTGVKYTQLEDGSYNFDVTLYHDDDGEAPNYADSWEVESMNGTLLGTRVLAHSHGTVEFTRSANIGIPEDIDELVIRGHDQIHGYGGQVILVKISTNERILYDQGAEMMNFTDKIFSEIESPISDQNEAIISQIYIFSIFIFVYIKKIDN